MKGIIFNILEDFVVSHHGEEAYEALLEKTTLKTTEPFVGPGTYEDADLLALVSTASQMLKVDPNDLVRVFGEFCFSKLAEKFPHFVTPHKEPKSFLKSVHGIIHVEVRKLYKDALTPVFRIEEPSGEQFILQYESPRKLCPLVEGLLKGVGNQFNFEIGMKQTQCCHKGASFCQWELSFEQKAVAA